MVIVGQQGRFHAGVAGLGRLWRAAVVFGLGLISSASGCGAGSGTADADAAETVDTPDLVEAGDDGVALDDSDGSYDEGPDEVAPEDYPEGGADDGSEDDGANPDCPSNLYIPAPTTATPGWWSPGNTEGFYETPSGYAWARRAEGDDAWFLVRTPDTFDSFDTSLNLEGLPVVVAGGEPAPVGVAVVGAFEPATSRLLFVMHPATGGTYGAIYGLDGRPVSAPFLVDDWPTDLTELRGMYAAPTSSGFAVLICRQDPAALPETCINCRAIGVASEGGPTGATTEVDGLSFNWGAVAWDGSRFVILHTAGCGAAADELRWLTIAPGAAVVGPLPVVGVSPAAATVVPSLSGDGVAVIVKRRTAESQDELSLVRLNVAGVVVGGPTVLFESPIVPDLRLEPEPGGGYALLIGQGATGPAGARVRFVRVLSDGTVVQDTVLQDAIPTAPSVPVLRWRDDHFIAAWGYPIRIGSLVCTSPAP